jgi:hypothetical protein
MPINKTSLLTKLTSLINDYTVESTVASDILLNTLSINSLNESNIIVVDDYYGLPNLSYYDSPSGMIYFIQKDYIFAISSGTKWLTLDGKLIRQDINVKLAYAWGCNSFFNLGDGTNVNKSSPVSVIGGFTDWCQISAGNNSALAIRTNGTAWAWGSNGYAQLGDGTVVNKSSPVSVVGDFTDWCQVATGTNHSLGVRTNGTAWAWGAATQGQLGDGGRTIRSSPFLVCGGFTDWCQVSTGGSHSLGVRTNGTAWAWGFNTINGQLGDNTVVGKCSPVSVVGGFTDWCQVSAGNAHSLGLRSNCTLWAWGCNGFGQLGDNTNAAKSSPVSVIGGFTNWCQVSAGFNHSLGLRTNGTLWAWGQNSGGRLGDGTTTIRSSPVSVVGGFTDWCQVSAGFEHSLAVRSNGTAWAWGANGAGLIGDNTTVSKSSPVSVIGGFTDWCRVSAGGCLSLGIRIV